jgi:hypothetical protein
MFHARFRRFRSQEAKKAEDIEKLVESNDNYQKMSWLALMKQRFGGNQYKRVVNEEDGYLPEADNSIYDEPTNIALSRLLRSAANH